MPTHPDAIGYLSDLAREINEPWFNMVCDLAVAGDVSTLDLSVLEDLSALYTGRASYIGSKPPAGAETAVASAVSADFLEHLSGFTNFKLLCDSLNASFKKRVTLIFGANGSGKSSLCESLKVLATPGPPNRPLENVRVTGVAPPTFRFKFKSDSVQQTWTPATGYGSRRSTVKYFDTAVAVQNVTNAVEPGRIIILAPFKLHIFDRTKALTTKFREVLQQNQSDNSQKLTQALQAIRSDFAKFKSRPLAVIEDRSVSTLPDQIKLGEDFKDQKLLGEKQAVVAALEKATSEEGLRLLRAEYRELDYLLNSLNTLLISAENLWALDPVGKAKALFEKQAAQEVVAKALIPAGSTLDDLLTLLRATSQICEMDEATGCACPLCKRNLGISEVALFRQYHALLTGDIEKEIVATKADIDKAGEMATEVGQVDREEWNKCKTIPEEILFAVRTNSDIIVTNCDIARDPSVEAKAAHASLKSAATDWATLLESKKTAIETAEKGRSELVKHMQEMRTAIEPLEYAQAVAVQMEALKAAQSMVNESLFWSERIPAFTQVLKRITDKSKDAYGELVIADFEVRLDSEYKVLAEKDMAAFGVKLARKGADAAVTVLPHVGGKGLEGIFSEGEQRLHALALFFAEIETCPQSVLVFDDPISSFDYNYIANYCGRLRDFAVKFQDRQIIVLTHNWEFFVQLQQTMHRASLHNHLAVHVLENCAFVADYSEKIDELKNDINNILAMPGEPKKPEKEELAGKMRRLIEAVVNSHVFNNQRHQYKQKNQDVTAFQSFTKVVALLPAEATTLRDLYAKLSISEHDDPRLAYVNTDKTTFQNRYQQILTIETAVKGRIPP